MKKNTLAKWMLAGSAMVLAFACQSKTLPETSGKDPSSCPCNSGCSSLVEPVVSDSKTAMNDVATKGDNAEEISTYTIEIEDAEAADSSSAPVVTPVVTESTSAVEEVSDTEEDAPQSGEDTQISSAPDSEGAAS